MAGYATPSWANGSSPAINASNLTALGQAAEIAEHPYGVCATGESTAAKSVIVDFSGTLSLFSGLHVRIKFSNSNSAASPTLNVNGTGAKSIKSYGTTAATTWVAGQVIDFVYDGTNWLFSGVDAFTKNQSLSSATASSIYDLSGTLPNSPDEAIALLATAVFSKISSGQYTGTGTFGANNPKSLTFPFTPKLIFLNETVNEYLTDGFRGCFIWISGVTSIDTRAADNSGTSWPAGTIYFTQAGQTVSWYSDKNANSQFNKNGRKYYYIAIGV